MFAFRKMETHVEYMARRATLPLLCNYSSPKEFMFASRYRRNHPFLRDLAVWPQIVSDFFEADTEYFAKSVLNHNPGKMRFSENKEHALQFCCVYSIFESEHNLVQGGLMTQIAEAIAGGENIKIGCANWLARYRETCNCSYYPFDGCSNQREHLLAFYGVVIAFMNRVSCSKRKRQFYYNLLKLLYILDVDAILNFDYKILFNQQLKNSRHFLVTLYDWALFDKFDNKTIENIGWRAEEIKHSLGYVDNIAGQCSDDIVNDQIPLIADNVNIKDMFDMVNNFMNVPKIQSGVTNIFEQMNIFVVNNPTIQMFSFNHTVSLNKEQMCQFEEVVKQAQSDFFLCLKDSVIDGTRQMIALFMAVAVVAMLGYTITKYGTKIVITTLNLMYSFLFGQPDVNTYAKVQSGGISIPFLPAILFNNVLSPPAEIISKVWNNPQTDKFMRRVGYLGDPKIARGIDKISDWLTEMLNQIIKWYKEEILGIACPEDITSSCSPVLSWFEDCDKYVENYYSGDLKWNDANWTILMNLYGRGIALTRQSVFSEWKNDIWKVVFKLSNLLEKFNSHGRIGSTVRNPPVVIYLQGDTGVGKSSVTYPLSAEILKGIFQHEQPVFDIQKYWKKLIYMRSTEQEFWDGYENQLVTVFDDFGQLVDSASSPNLELFEIIRAANSFPYPLHMASLEQKATTSFNSKIIMVSSNMVQPKTESLNFPTALHRRFDICVRVSRKQGVVIEQGKFNPDIYEFQLYNMSTGVLGANITYKELVHMAASEYFKRKGFVSSMESYIHQALSTEELPKVQGVGAFLGSVVGGINDIHDGMKAYCYRQYEDFVMNREMTSLSGSLSPIKILRPTIAEKWKVFQEKHSYIVKAMKFIGVATLIFGGIKLFYSMTTHKKPEKFMSTAQFINSSAKYEAYSVKTVPLAKIENYNQQKVVTAKIEVESATPQMTISDPAPTQVKIQGVRDTNAAEQLVSVLTRNLYKMFNADTHTPVGHVLFLRGKIVLCPRHYLIEMKRMVDENSEAQVYFQSAFLDRSFYISVSELMSTAIKLWEDPTRPHETRDFMVMAVSTATYHANILPYFAKKRDLHYVTDSKVVLPILITNNIRDSRKSVVGFRYTTGRSEISVVDDVTVLGNDNLPLQKMRNLWCYNMDTNPSECGAPLFARNVNIGVGKIVGIHVAGMDGPGVGYSTPIYSEDVELLVSRMNKWDSIEFRPKVQMNTEFVGKFVPNDSEFLRLGTVDRPVAQPSNSKIRPSSIFGKIREPITRPCLLNGSVINGDKFEPRMYRLRKLGNVPTYVSSRKVELAQDALIDHMCSRMQNFNFGPNVKPKYTFEEAVAGIDGEEFINSIKRTTSPGYPFVHLKGFETRKKIFGDDEKCDSSITQAQIVKRRVEDIIDNAKRGIAFDHIFMDTLKDERKLIEKSHKTRLFSAGPLDYLIACKQYFNGIVHVLQKTRNRNGISVGSNVYSRDWDDIVRELLSKSPHIVAGDFEGFDASQNVQLLSAAGRVLIELSKRFCGSTDEDANVMWVLLVSLINSTHISGNEIYQWTHSLPSGHYLTAIINSIFVLLSFSLTWMHAFDSFSYSMARNFFNECGIVAYGDDHLVAIPRVRLEKFNQIVLPSLMSKIGLSYTMEDKDVIATEMSRKIEKVSFLKRGFKWDSDRLRWIAPLSIDTILESPMWIHKCPDVDYQTKAQIDNSLRELSLHGIDVWNRWFPIMDLAARSINHFTMHKYQEEVQREVLGD